MHVDLARFSPIDGPSHMWLGECYHVATPKPEAKKTPTHSVSTNLAKSSLTGFTGSIRRKDGQKLAIER